MIENKLYSELFEDFGNCKTKVDRINFLRTVRDPKFKIFLQGSFDPRIVFDVELPEKYRPAPEPAGMTWTTLSGEMDKMYRFVQNHPAKPVGLTKEKETAILQVVLESLHKDEARLLVQMLQKKLQIPFLKKELVLEAFPGLF
jgi:hypothetical protein